MDPESANGKGPADAGNGEGSLPDESDEEPDEPDILTQEEEEE